MVDPDEENLKLISIFHYVVGGLGVLFACFPLIHVSLGLMMVTGHFNEMMQQGHPPGPPFPSQFGWFFVAIGGAFFLIGQFCAISMIISGRYIAQRKHYTFSFVIACIECVFFPFGTALGVFTIITFSRESVKVLFGRGTASAPPPVVVR